MWHDYWVCSRNYGVSHKELGVLRRMHYFKCASGYA